MQDSVKLAQRIVRDRMSLKYQTFVLGPIDNNTYLVWDDETKQCVVIDPSFEPTPVIEAIQDKQLILSFRQLILIKMGFRSRQPPEYLTLISVLPNSQR